MIRFGLCCQFQRAPIKFRTTTVTYLKKLGSERFEYLDALVLDNIRALRDAILCCKALGIGAFRVNSQFLPAYTHPDVRYTLFDTHVEQLKECGAIAQREGVRLTFHPDQFVVLSTPHEHVLEKSLEEIEYHAMLADLIGADVINIHGGGVYGDKASALKRFAAAFERLSESAKSKLTVENDDKSYTPKDLLPLCKELGIPLVYDVHHHRCLPDGLSEREATEAALTTWGEREPLFHISSPLNGWEGKATNRHHDEIDRADFPDFWLEIDQFTVDIEAKGKELAILKLMKELKARA